MGQHLSVMPPDMKMSLQLAVWPMHQSTQIGLVVLPCEDIFTLDWNC